MTGKKRSMELLNVGDEDQLKKKRLITLMHGGKGKSLEFQPNHELTDRARMFLPLLQESNETLNENDSIDPFEIVSENGEHESEVSEEDSDDGLNETDSSVSEGEDEEDEDLYSDGVSESLDQVTEFAPQEEDEIIRFPSIGGKSVKPINITNLNSEQEEENSTEGVAVEMNIFIGAASEEGMTNLGGGNEVNGDHDDDSGLFHGSEANDLSWTK